MLWNSGYGYCKIIISELYTPGSAESGSTLRLGDAAREPAALFAMTQNLFKISRRRVFNGANFFKLDELS
jgi:hypothetical protein